MWKRSVLKKSARSAYRKNMWAMIIICFLLSFLVGEYNNSLSTLLQYNPENETEETVINREYGEDHYTTLEVFLSGLREETEDIRKDDEQFATRGVLSSLVNSVTNTNGVVFQALRAWNSFWQQNQVLTGILLLAGVLIRLLYGFLLANLLRVGTQRFFLESRLYTDTLASRIFFLFQEKKVKNPVLVMMARDIFLLFWMFTIVGGFIKAYEYRMIPYLLAENPDMSRKQAFALSKQMMKGNKWNTFVLDLSFWYWHALGALTLGILGIFFVNPYMEATNAELYMTLRGRALEQKMIFSEALNDPYLACKPDPA